MCSFTNTKKRGRDDTKRVLLFPFFSEHYSSNGDERTAASVHRQRCCSAEMQLLPRSLQPETWNLGMGGETTFPVEESCWKFISNFTNKITKMAEKAVEMWETGRDFAVREIKQRLTLIHCWFWCCLLKKRVGGVVFSYYLGNHSHSRFSLRSRVFIFKKKKNTCIECKCVCLQDKVYQFCSKVCCEDYKKLHCIVTFCEYCQEEKTLHETVKFSGVKRPFCSEGSNLLCYCTHWDDFQVACHYAIISCKMCLLLSYSQGVSCCLSRISSRGWVWSAWAATTVTSSVRKASPDSLEAQLGTSAARPAPRSSTTGSSRFVASHLHLSGKKKKFKSDLNRCSKTPPLFLATRRRGVTAVRCRVTSQSLWCGEQRWNSSVTKIVCWSSTASRTSPSWSLRKAQRTPA